MLESNHLELLEYHYFLKYAKGKFATFRILWAKKWSPWEECK